MDLRNPNRANSGPDGTFVDRNTTPGAERPGTVIDANTFNQMLIEFENLIKGAGLEPSSTDLSQLAKINGDILIKNIQNIAYPIGYDWIQIAEDDGTFDTNKHPANLVGGTWSLRYSGDSVYLRTEGTLANEGGRNAKGIQAGAERRVTGYTSAGTTQGNALSVFDNFEGAFRSGPAGSFSATNSANNNKLYQSFVYDNSLVIPTSNTEVRVANIKMRLYRKMAND